MRPLIFTAILTIFSTSAAMADTWECIDSGDGHVYKATQSVPVDKCKLIARTPESEESKRLRAMVAIPLSERTTTAQIGMSRAEVMLSRWGYPDKIHKTTTASGVREQWVYGDGKYLYFVDGVLTAIQD